jgi:hypothetical protein
MARSAACADKPEPTAMSDDSSAQTPPNMIAKFLIDISSYEDRLRGSVKRFHAQSK